MRHKNIIEKSVYHDLYQIIKPFFKKFLIACGFIGFNAACILVLAYNFHTFFLDQSGFPTLGCFMILLVAIGTGLRLYNINRFGEYLLHYIRIKSLSLTLLSKSHEENLTLNATHDANQIQSIITSTLPSLIRNSSILIGSLGLLIWNTPKLVVICMIACIFYITISQKFKKKSRFYSFIAQKNFIKTIDFAQERTDLQDIVKLFGQQKNDLKDYESLSLKTSKSWNKSGFWRSLNSTVSIIVGGFMGVGFVMWSKWAVENHILTPDQLTSSMVLIFVAAQSASTLVDCNVSIQRVHPNITAIAKIISQKWPEVITPNPKTLGADAPEIEFKNICVDIHGHKILKNTSLKIKKGINLAITGPSGGGKTTLIKTLLGQINPQSGEILWDGKNILQLPVEDRLIHIATVPQTPELWDDTILKNISYGNSKSEEELKKALDTSQAQFANKEQWRNEHVGIRGQNLSGGQRQRIAIARAVARHSPVIVLDEATSALDASTEHALHQAFQSHKNQTIITIAHRLSTLQEADQIAWMENGEITHIGTHEELIKNCIGYKQLVLHHLQQD